MSYRASFQPGLGARIDPDLPAGFETSRYQFQTGGREPNTMLFLGSFRHVPNQEALDWFTRRVLPRVLDGCPQARLIIIGSAPPPRHSLPDLSEAIEFRGFLQAVPGPLARLPGFL